MVSGGGGGRAAGRCGRAGGGEHRPPHPRPAGGCPRGAPARLRRGWVLGGDRQRGARRFPARGAPPLSRRGERAVRRDPRRGKGEGARGRGGGRPACARPRAAPQAKFPAAVTALTAPGFPAGTAPCCTRTGKIGCGSGTFSRYEPRGHRSRRCRLTSNRPRAEERPVPVPPCTARGVPWLPRWRRGSGNPKESW